MLYKEGPEVNHADYIVVIKTENDTFNWISLLGHVRMATTTVKVCEKSYLKNILCIEFFFKSSYVFILN